MTMRKRAAERNKTDPQTARQRKRTGSQIKAPIGAVGLYPAGLYPGRKIYSEWQKSLPWARLEQLRGQLSSAKEPTKRALKSSWEAINRENVRLPLELMGLSGPFEGLMLYIGLGKYPPAELLLWVEERWNIYIRAAGSMSLEEAFIGKPVKKGGGVASQTIIKMRNQWLARLLRAIRREKPELSNFDQAAEIARSEHGIAIDETSLPRLARSANLGSVADDGWDSMHCAAIAKWLIDSKLESKRRKNKRIIVPRKDR